MVACDPAMPPRPVSARHAARSGTHAPTAPRARCTASCFWSLCAAITAVGCAPDDRPTLVALPGCGLDDIDLSVLLLVPRGDFPAAAADGTVADGGRSGLTGVPEDALGITVEGKFADATLAVGRTARLEEPDGRLPIYFAPPDDLCAVRSGAGVAVREVGAAAVGADGDIVFVGGRDEQDRLVDDVVATQDIGDFVAPLAESLPSPTTGMTVVPTGGRTFAAIGGATADGRVLDHWIPIDLGASRPVGPPERIDVPGGAARRAYHASALLPDGRVLVVGGCTSLDLDSRCTLVPGALLDSSILVSLGPQMRTYDRGPSLVVARYDHELLVARDGVVFVVGGINRDGRGVLTIERWSADAPAWTPYGRTERLDLDADDRIIGATLLEGGLIVVSLSDGGIGWVTENGGGRWTEWCDGDPTTPGCFHDESAAPPALARRPMLTLGGERVLVDSLLLSFPMLGTTPMNVVDLSVPEPGSVEVPPPPRTGAALASLADGTVMIAGGRDTRTAEPSTPFLLRLRPRLDGPDERIPGVESFETGSFVLHDPQRIGLADGHMVLRSEGDALSYPDVWAHVRSFRSASFRFDVTLGTEPVGSDPVVPHLVLSQGAVAGTSISFGAGVSGTRRDARGQLVTFSCSARALDFGSGLVGLRVDVRPDAIVVRSGGDVVASCPGAGDVPSAIGLGVSGEGTLVAYSPLLTRI